MDRGGGGGCSLNTIVPYIPIYSYSLNYIQVSYEQLMNIPEATQLIHSPSLYIWMLHSNILTSKKRLLVKSNTSARCSWSKRTVNLEVV